MVGVERFGSGLGVAGADEKGVKAGINGRSLGELPAQRESSE
jgi:ribosome modulation factor